MVESQLKGLLGDSVKKGLLRTLGAMLGLAFILVAVPLGNMDRGFWPPWVIVISFFGFGVLLLHYAVTGRSKLFRRNDSDG